MSAMTNLAALFSPEGISVWNPSLPWQPIPVHTVPISEDRVSIMENRGISLVLEEERKAAQDLWSWESGHFMGCAVLILS